jgi:hypothetical protein
MAERDDAPIRVPTPLRARDALVARCRQKIPPGPVPPALMRRRSGGWTGVRAVSVAPLALLTDPGTRGTIATCVAAAVLGVALALITT